MITSSVGGASLVMTSSVGGTSLMINSSVGGASLMMSSSVGGADLPKSKISLTEFVFIGSKSRCQILESASNYYYFI